jgi:hypothetical protein
MLQKIPLTATHNQELLISLQVNEENILFKFNLNFNKTANYWILKITDPKDESIIMDSLPLVAGEEDTLSLNILRSFAYLLIGEAYLIPRKTNPSSDFPNETNLETEFELTWDDNG